MESSAMDSSTVLQRSLCALLVFYSLGVVLCLLAGATLIAHVNPVSKCILFSYQQGANLFYGSEYYCHLLGYAYIIVILLILLQIYYTVKCRKDVSKSLKYSYKNSAFLKIPRKIVCIHISVTALVLFLTIFITVGYGTACHNLSSYIRDRIRQKYDENQADVMREESLTDTGLEDDQQFWRYVGGVQNAFGGEFYDQRISCGNVLTDPDIYNQLDATHYEKYAGYFGYWYHEDITVSNSQTEATTINALLDGSLAGAWLSVIVWVGSLAFILVQRKKLRGTGTTETDRVSVHSSSSTNNNTVKQGSLSGSSNRSIHLPQPSDSVHASRRDMDNLALESLHLQTETSAFLAPPQRGDIHKQKQHQVQAGGSRRGSSGSNRLPPQTGILKTGSTGSHIGSSGGRSGSLGSHTCHQETFTYPTGGHDEAYCARPASAARLAGSSRNRSSGSSRHPGNQSWETEIM